MIVNNMDMAGVISRMRRFRYETIKAVSSGVANVSGSDVLRLKSYSSAVTQYLDWVASSPVLDLPESSPREYDMGEPEKLDMPENESLVDVMRLWDVAELEVSNSQSARNATGIISHDEKRIRDIIQKMEAFIDGYIAQVQPLDLPESAPLRPNTGAGRTGI